MKKLVVTLFWIVVITFWITLATTPRSSQVGRYQMFVFSDGEVIVFDSAYGQPRVVRKAQADHVPPAPPEQRDLPNDLRGQSF